MGVPAVPDQGMVLPVARDALWIFNMHWGAAKANPQIMPYGVHACSSRYCEVIRETCLSPPEHGKDVL
jgi:hypothetical protein